MDAEAIALLSERPDDPVWKEARARYGKLAPLIRIVDLFHGTDEIIPLPAMKDLAELRLDGCVVIKPDAGPADNNQTRPSAPDRGQRRN